MRESSIRSELVFRLNDATGTANKYFANQTFASPLNALLGEEMDAENVSDPFAKDKDEA